MIEVQHLTKRYGAHTAVNDLSFTAQPGRIYGFLGPNGAGKTTTMNIMTGYLAATSGTVLIGGKDIQKEPEEAKQQIGYLPEVPPVYSDMTVYEYLRFAAELKKVPKKERLDAIEAAMQASEVLEVEDRLIRNLSKGFRQRVGLAQALVGNPSVLILDEPTAGLDPEQQREMFDYIRSFKKDHTIILSSHILSDIRAIADYVWIINNGMLVASDTPENLQSHLQSEQEVVLRAQGSREGILKALNGVARVSRVECSEETDGTLCFTITSDYDEDIRPAVSRAAVYAGAAILGMSRAEKSLEDVFFQLTGEAAARAAAHNEFIAQPPVSGQQEDAADPAEEAVPLPNTAQFTDFVTVDENRDGSGGTSPRPAGETYSPETAPDSRAGADTQTPGGGTPSPQAPDGAEKGGTLNAAGPSPDSAGKEGALDAAGHSSDEAGEDGVFDTVGPSPDGAEKEAVPGASAPSDSSRRSM